MPDLSTRIGELELRNPTMLASGILGISGSLLKRVAKAGAGAVVTKSVGPKERKGNPGPVLVDLGYAYLNAMGLSNPGIDSFAEEIRIAKEGGVPVIVSVFGDTPDEYAQVAKKAEEAGADAIELNVSCPHEKLVEVCLSAEHLEEVVKAAKKAVKVPVFVKISPLVPNAGEVGKVIEKAGGDCVVATNTMKAMSISLEVRKPVLSAKIGGLSGKALKPLALRCVYELYEEVSIPIVGCGGVYSWRDAVEFLMAGAVAVQIGSAVADRGLGIFGEVCKGLDEFLEKEGFKSVKELVGIAHEP